MDRSALNIVENVYFPLQTDQGNLHVIRGKVWKLGERKLSSLEDPIEKKIKQLQKQDGAVEYKYSDRDGKEQVYYRLPKKHAKKLLDWYQELDEKVQTRQDTIEGLEQAIKEEKQRKKKLKQQERKYEGKMAEGQQYQVLVDLIRGEIEDVKERIRHYEQEIKTLKENLPMKKTETWCTLEDGRLLLFKGRCSSDQIFWNKAYPRRREEVDPKIQKRLRKWLVRALLVYGCFTTGLLFFPYAMYYIQYWIGPWWRFIIGFALAGIIFGKLWIDEKLRRQVLHAFGVTIAGRSGMESHKLGETHETLTGKTYKHVDVAWSQAQKIVEGPLYHKDPDQMKTIEEEVMAREYNNMDRELKKSYRRIQQEQERVADKEEEVLAETQRANEAMAAGGAIVAEQMNIAQESPLQREEGGFGLSEPLIFLGVISVLVGGLSFFFFNLNTLVQYGLLIFGAIMAFIGMYGWATGRARGQQMGYMMQQAQRGSERGQQRRR